MKKIKEEYAKIHTEHKDIPVKEPWRWYDENTVTVYSDLNKTWTEDKSGNVIECRYQIHIDFVSIDDFSASYFYDFTDKDGNPEEIYKSVKEKLYDNIPLPVSIDWLKENNFYLG